MLGPDVMISGANGGTLQQFNAIVGGLPFPLLRDCADGVATVDSNIIRPYFQRENYVVINKQGVIRYHANDFWTYGNRFHPDEILATVDSLVDHNTGVGEPRVSAWGLAASPNPARGLVTLTLANPTAEAVRARVRVLDLAGRRVAQLPETMARSGTTRVFWDGLGARGETLPAGVYLVSAELGGTRLVRRVAITR